MSVYVVRAFVRLRDFARGHGAITATLRALERKVVGHDEALKELFAGVGGLFWAPHTPSRPIGFKHK
jgi:hypothetical protein